MKFWPTDAVGWTALTAHCLTIVMVVCVTTWIWIDRRTRYRVLAEMEREHKERLRQLRSAAEAAQSNVDAFVGKARDEQGQR